MRWDLTWALRVNPSCLAMYSSAVFPMKPGPVNPVTTMGLLFLTGLISTISTLLDIPRIRIESVSRV